MEQKQYLVNKQFDGDCFKNLQNIDSLESLTNAFCHAKIHFDTHPDNYTKLDYMYFIDTIYDSLRTLYIKDPGVATKVPTLVGIASLDTNPEQDKIDKAMPVEGIYLINTAGKYTNIFDEDGEPTEITVDDLANIVVLLPKFDQDYVYYEKVLYALNTNNTLIHENIKVIIPKGHTLGRYKSGDTIECKNVDLNTFAHLIAQSPLIPHIESEIIAPKISPIYGENTDTDVEIEYIVTIMSIDETEMAHDYPQVQYSRGDVVYDQENINIELSSRELNDLNQYVYTYKVKFTVTNDFTQPDWNKDIDVQFKVKDVIGSEKEVSVDTTHIPWGKRNDDEIHISINNNNITSNSFDITLFDLPKFTISATQNNNDWSIKSLNLFNGDNLLESTDTNSLEYEEKIELNDYQYKIEVEYKDGHVVTREFSIERKFPMCYGFMSTSTITKLVTSYELKEFQKLFISMEEILDEDGEVFSKEIRCQTFPFDEIKNYYGELKMNIPKAGNENYYHAVIAYPATNAEGDQETGKLTKIIKNNTIQSEEGNDHSVSELSGFIMYESPIQIRTYEVNGESHTVSFIEIDGRPYYLYYSEYAQPFNEDDSLIIY